jgi:ribokinase
MYDVITFGSATVDIFAQTKSKLIKIMDSNSETDLLAFSTGSKLLIDELGYTLGGGGTNTAAAFSSLGLKVAFIGKVGSGFNGKLIMHHLKKNEIDTRFVKRCKDHTGVSIILDNIEKDRVILAHKGANDHLTTRDFKLSQLKTGWIHSSSLVGESFKTLIKVGEYAKRNNIGLSFNPSSYMTEKGIFYLRPVLRNTDVLIFNLHEATLLTKEEKLTSIMRKLLSLGPRIIVITDGKRGVHTTDSKHMYSLPARKVKAKDTTGAGDAFAASFLAGMIRKKPIEWCLRMGVENAASIIQSIGAKNGLMGWNQANKAVRENKSKIRKTRLY